MSGAIYNDFTQFTTLRAQAAKNPNAALEEVAAQFESIFLQQMLKSMRDATVKSDLFDSSQMDTYQGMADQQLALKLAEGGGIGLARMMVEQMQSKGYVADEMGVSEAPLSKLTTENDIQGFRLRAADAYENGSKD
jgi:Rod binding domain-containing protein